MKVLSKVLKVILVLACMGLVVGNGYAQCDPSSDLSQPYTPDDCTVLLLHFDEGSGNTAYDESNNGNDGTIYGAEWISNGKFGDALYFDGYADEGGDSLKIYLDDVSFMAGPHTLEAWIYPLSIGTQQTILSLYGGHDQIPIYIWPDGRLSFRVVHDNPNYHEEILSTTSLQANNWYHIAGVWDGSEMAIYVNGVKENSKMLSYTPSVPPRNMLDLGKVWTAASTPNGARSFFNGYIDEVRISSVARTFNGGQHSHIFVSVFDAVSKAPIEESCKITIYDNFGNWIKDINSTASDIEFELISPGEYSIRCEIIGYSPSPYKFISLPEQDGILIDFNMFKYTDNLALCVNWGDITQFLDFYDFCNGPYLMEEHPISTILLGGIPHELVSSNDPLLVEFVEGAHDYDIKVMRMMMEDARYVMRPTMEWKEINHPEHPSIIEELEAVVNFGGNNLYSRLDGFLIDVEPHTLNNLKTYPEVCLRWDTDAHLLWEGGTTPTICQPELPYIIGMRGLLKGIREFVENSNHPSIKFGACVPCCYEEDPRLENYEEVIDDLDYIFSMTYDPEPCWQNTDIIYEKTLFEIENINKEHSVLVGLGIYGDFRNIDYLTSAISQLNNQITANNYLDKLDGFFIWNYELLLSAYKGNSFGLSGLCPITLKVIDPLGREIDIQNIISGQSGTNYRNLFTIPYSAYVEYDIDGNGELDEFIFIPTKETGIYQIFAEPKASASDSDEFTIIIDDEEFTHRDTLVLKEFVLNIPPGGYRYSTLDTGAIHGFVVIDSGILHGVPVDLYDENGNVIINTTTDESGCYHFPGLDNRMYSVCISTPLGYRTEAETKQIEVKGLPHEVNFELTELEITPKQRSRGYWAHQLCRALWNWPKDYTLEDFSKFASLINKHFNQNQINPVDFYSVPQPADQEDSLQVLKELLHMCNTGEWEPFTKRLAKAQLMALMLNVVSGKISQTEEISKDGRTVSQAITYCDLLVNDEIDPPGGVCRYLRASLILGLANLGLKVPAGMIPEDVIEIAYKMHNPKNVPDGFSLSQNYPNPFNPVTEISYTLPHESNVKLVIYNVKGQKVKVLVDEYQSAGYKSVNWDGKDEKGSPVASGVYFYKLSLGNQVMSKKMLLLK